MSIDNCLAALTVLNIVISFSDRFGLSSLNSLSPINSLNPAVFVVRNNSAYAVGMTVELAQIAREENQSCWGGSIVALLKCSLYPQASLASNYLTLYASQAAFLSSCAFIQRCYGRFSAATRHKPPFKNRKDFMIADSPITIAHKKKEDFSSTLAPSYLPTPLKSDVVSATYAHQDFLARLDTLTATTTVNETLDLTALLTAEVGINVSSMRLARGNFITEWNSPHPIPNDNNRTLHANVECNALEADCAGAFDMMRERAVNAVLRAALIQIERCSRRAWEYAPPVHESESTRRLAADIERVARLPYSVLITGETGTGKTRAAREIYQCSARSGKPFVELNCAALPEHLVESELFGYRKGAFTGADRDHKGLFEEADGGVLFLDEIGDLPLPVQNKILKAIDEKQIKRLGTNHYVTCDVQIIAATSRDLIEMTRQGSFREDLYCRLAMLQIAIAPLRDRREKIPTLIDAFLREASDTVSRSVSRAISYRIEAGAVEALCAHDWVGNVRVLRNTICELTSYVKDDELITLESVLRILAKASQQNLSPSAHPPSTCNAVFNPISMAGRQSLEEDEAAALLQLFAREGDIILPVEVCLLRRHETLDEWTARIKRCGIEATRQASGGTMREAALRLGVTEWSLKSHLYRAGRSHTAKHKG